MAKPKPKLTATQKTEKAQFMTIFINGKHKRIRRPVLIVGLDPDEFYARNADSIALYQDGHWECMVQVEQADLASNTDENAAEAKAADCFGHSG